MSDEHELSDVPCPLCGYRPRTGLEAFRHLCGHVVGSHTNGVEQVKQLEGDA